MTTALAHIPVNMLEGDELCRRHENCGCKASECTCKDEEIHRYEADECLITSHDCETAAPKPVALLRFEGFITFFQGPKEVVFSYLVNQHDPFAFTSQILTEIFHPPDLLSPYFL
jgi:hypothetical protein